MTSKKPSIQTLEFMEKVTDKITKLQEQTTTQEICLTSIKKDIEAIRENQKNTNDYLKTAFKSMADEVRLIDKGKSDIWVEMYLKKAGWLVISTIIGGLVYLLIEHNNGGF